MVAQVDLRPLDHVLEVGCGHGVAISLLAERLPLGRVVAVDRSAAMVASARRRNAALVDAGRVEVREGTFGALGWTDPQFDHLVALDAADLARRADRCLPEAARVLRAGGRLWWAMHDPPGATGRPRGTDALVEALPRHGFEVQRAAGVTLDDGTRMALVVARRP